jgi:CheY-like chemotaxis protein
VSQQEQKMSVLIVDDNRSVRRVVCELLERRGYLVVGEAGCCASALELFERLKPDAVLLDVQLPDGTGFLVSSILALADPAPAVLLMSATDHLAGYELVEPSGARGLVAKAELAAIDLDRFWPFS